MSSSIRSMKRNIAKRNGTLINWGRRSNVPTKAAIKEQKRREKAERKDLLKSKRSIQKKRKNRSKLKI